MPKTLLAVDDSATMRKVLAITFAGDDFRVVAADGPQNALAHMSDGPVAAVIDASLDGDGYALAKEMRSRDARLAIVLLTSRYNPYDPGRGRDSGADDYADKPFDTQALLDKVKKAIVARETGKAAAAPAPVAAAPAPPPVPPPSAPRAPGPGAPPQRPVFATQRTHTLSFEGASPAPPPMAPTIARTAPSGTPIVQVPARAPAAAAPPVAPAPVPTAPAPAQTSTSEHSIRTAVPPRPAEAASAGASANGQLATKLGELGLTTQQVEAVLALSREVVERVVWEVVPQLAEALIKEEITRLTKE